MWDMINRTSSMPKALNRQSPEAYSAAVAIAHACMVPKWLRFLLLLGNSTVHEPAVSWRIFNRWGRLKGTTSCIHLLNTPVLPLLASFKAQRNMRF